MRALGITCGIGSLLVGAREAGFEIVGNIEWRKYYHKKDKNGNNTFLNNFPGAFFVENFLHLNPGQIQDIVGKIDLAMGHPECGNYSQLNMNRAAHVDNPGDIPLFIDLVAKIKPRYFIMDDLPMAFVAVPMAEYAKKLPEYDLFPEMISNYHYGNIQKNRKRMFMIGALKTEKFVFEPDESDHPFTMASVIGDLLGKEGKVPNHDVHNLTASSSRAIHMRFRGDHPTWAEVREYFSNQPEGRIFQYFGPEGGLNNRPGFRKGHWNGHSGVLSGQNPDVHPVTNLPLSIRERARIQGFPDDFIFYGTVYEEDGTWNTERNTHMIKQTGKAMPIQFAISISKQIADWIKGGVKPTTGKRFLGDNSFVKEAKTWYCKHIGYAQQDRVCKACHSKGTCEGITPELEVNK